ncbi:hypothetical protein [Flavobacterium notoginsengisoli]|uniref:hypothetical protein n=1 Tax=Flavobacterium notoginsengisoli TaxID=1478199 RepID=UPI00362F9FCD
MKSILYHMYFTFSQFCIGVTGFYPDHIQNGRPIIKIAGIPKVLWFIKNIFYVA